MSEKNKNYLLNKKYYIVYSFLISALFVLIYYFVGGMFFGDYIVLRSDLISGIIGVIKESCRDIIQGEDIWYTFSTNLGSCNALNLASCSFSPFNILYLIFFNSDENIITALIVILKVGCISSSFNYFCKKVLKNDNFSGVIISVFYSLCSFTIAYGTIQICWLDALIILPLLICSIIDCIENDKRVLLTVLYTYLFISSFYMGYIVGIFSLVFVVLYSFLLYKQENKKKIYKKIFNWFLSALVAAMISAFVWVPTLFFILANRVEDSSAIISIDFSLLQVLNSLFWGNGYGIEGTYAYIYCGVPILILVPLYFLNKKINSKEKLFFAIILLILAICTIFVPLNTFIHVFDQPDSFWYRYSFVISFCLCAISAKQLLYISDFKFKPIFIILSVVSVFYLFEQQVISLWALDESFRPSQNNNNSFIVNIALLSVWIIILYVYLKLNKNILVCVLSIAVAGVELVSCAQIETSIKEESEHFYEWKAYMNQVSENINLDSDLFRVICNNNEYINDDSWFGFNGFTDLGSQEKLSVRNALCNLGFSTSTRYIDDGGHTPVSEMLLGVKYIIRRPYKMIEYDDNVLAENERFYYNDNYLGVGYLVSGETGFYEWDGRNVFENMNSLVSTMTGNEEKCYFEIPQENIQVDLFDMEVKEYADGGGRLKRTDEAGQMYITVFNDNYTKVYTQFETTDIGNYGYDFFIIGARNAGNVYLNNASLSTATEMYYDKEKDKYNVFITSEIQSSPETIDYDAINVYGLNEDVLNDQFNELYDGRLIVDKWSNGHIEGHVTSSGNKNLLFLSVPYDPGWNVTINGIDGEIVRVVDGAFMGVFLPGEGEYNIVFDYECPGLKIGKIVSLCGLLAFLSIVFEKKLKKKEVLSNGDLKTD